MSIEFNASGQALTAKYHIVHSFIIRGLTRTTAAEFCCPPKYVQNKRWLNFQLEELWSNTKSNKYPYSQNQRSVKIEVNKFWVEPGTPENYVIRLHPFIELWYRIWILMICTWWREFPRPHGSQVNSGSEVGKWSLDHCLRRNLTLPDFCCYCNVKWINLSEILVCL